METSTLVPACVVTTQAAHQAVLHVTPQLLLPLPHATYRAHLA
jgi:hypothetical protein